MAVTTDDIRAAAARIFAGTPTLAALGPIGHIPSLQSITENLAA